MGIFLKSIEKLIVRFNMAVVALSLSAMIVLGLVQVVMRNFFDSGLAWADIVIRNLVLWVGFAGAVVATSRGQHIAIGALVKFIPRRLRRVVYFIVSIFTSLTCLFLFIASIEFIITEMELGSVLYGKIPVWISELIMPSTFLFLTCLFLIHAFEAPKMEEEAL